MLFQIKSKPNLILGGRVCVRIYIKYFIRLNKCREFKSQLMYVVTN